MLKSVFPPRGSQSLIRLTPGLGKSRDLDIHASTLSLGSFIVVFHCLSWLLADFHWLSVLYRGGYSPFSRWVVTFPSLEQSTVRPLTQLPLQFTGW